MFLRRRGPSGRLFKDHSQRENVLQSFLGDSDLGKPHGFYPGMFGGLANVLVLGSIGYLVALLRSDSYEDNYRNETFRFSTYEVVAWGSIAAVPLFAMILAKTVTHGYIERYALSGIIGGVVLLCHFGFAAAPRPRSFPLILSSVGLLYFVFHSIWIVRIQGLTISALAEQMQLLDSHSSSPIAVSDITLSSDIVLCA